MKTINWKDCQDKKRKKKTIATFHISKFQGKGRPYCHKPCYAMLFGPQMMGYGSNVVSPANFKRNSDSTLYNGEYDFDLKQVFESGEMIHSNGNSQHNGVLNQKRHSHNTPQARANPNQIMEFDFLSETAAESRQIIGSPKKRTPRAISEYTGRE